MKKKNNNNGINFNVLAQFLTVCPDSSPMDSSPVITHEVGKSVVLKLSISMEIYTF